jgi:hypothetical protein
LGNLFADKPEVTEVVVPDYWVCPVTGLRVPKDPEANLQWRAQLLSEAEKDEELRVDLYTACSQSILFFVNAFAFTLRVFESENGISKQSENKHLPYVTWPVQDKHILRIEHAVESGESLLTDKSRDMGATWDHLIVLIHRFLFHPDESHLMISRKEDAVDVLDGPPKNYPFGSLADPGTLFGKIDYVLNRLPEWMVPRIVRKKMHIVNLENKTRIDGESSNASAGSSDRRTSIFLDEMAKMKEAEAIKRSTKDVTACRLVCSTPNGAGTAYSKWRMSGQIDVFVLAWWDHPEKGKGLYVKQDSLNRWKMRSPWYDAEEASRSPKELAIEVDMDHVGSGDTFFEATVIEQHRRICGRPPKMERQINFADSKKVSDDEVREALIKKNFKKVKIQGSRGPWKIWVNLTNHRPDQSKTYIIGIDISKGQGASNSTMSIMCVETREKIAEFADANTPPYELARLACAAALWCGGRSIPLIIWENNGDPGFDFGNQLANTYRYPNVYFDRQAGTLRQKVGKRWGWRSSPEKKALALGLLRRAYAHGKFVNHSGKALDEALSYIHYEDGGIGPAELVEESASNRKSHGDRVIADMLCIVGVQHAPKYRYDEASHPQRSIGYRLSQFKKAIKDKKKQTRFNFAEAS